MIHQLNIHKYIMDKIYQEIKKRFPEHPLQTGATFQKIKKNHPEYPPKNIRLD